MRVRRTTLATPASNLRMMRKALLELSADEVFFDLEDAVAPKEKAQARRNVIELLNEVGYIEGKTVSIRINGLHTDWWYDDLREVINGAGRYIDCVILPKVEGPEDVKIVDKILSRLEDVCGIGRRIGIEVLIENTRGLARCEEIANSSERLECLVFGPGDYSADAGIGMMTIGAHTVGYPGHIWHYAMFRINNAAKSASLQAIDGPYAVIGDLAGLEESARIAKQLGFDGKWVIHPSQIDTCNKMFTPSSEEIERAKALVEAYTGAREGGRGAISLGGEMVDEANYRMASRILETARRLGLV